MPKRSLLPPPTDTQKREVTVNLRFSAEMYTRLKAVADFSNTGVASLLFYVTVNTLLPMMEKEMRGAQPTITPAKDEPVTKLPPPIIPVSPKPE